MAKKKVKAAAEDALTVANNIWLAGLGALATTQEEGGKLFKHLVKKGEKVDLTGKIKEKTSVEETVEKARTKVSDAKDRIEGQVDKARDAVSDAWGDLTQVFDERLGGALHRLGVPTRDEIKTLTARVEALIEKVEQAEAKAKAPARRARKTSTSTAKKPVAKPRAKATKAEAATVKS